MTMARPEPSPRPRLRGLRMGLMTVLGLRRQGWFIPHRHAASVAAPDGYPGIEPVFDAARGRFTELLAEIDALAPDLGSIGGEPPPQPRWEQGWFPGLDAAAAYAMVRSRRPERIVEVGSGHSTRFLARAVADGGMATRITAIDPEPRADLSGLGVHHVRATVQDAGDAPFAELRGGDMMVVDSSHILMPGSDVDHILNRVWPGLAPGVVVHFHDILLPDGYPPSWTWRGYNEQLGVAALLSARGAEPLFASRYVRTRMADAFAGCWASRLPVMPGAVETGLWAVKG